MEIALCLVLGLIVGLVSATLGLGGGVLIVPLLPILFNFAQKEAVATSLVTVLCVVGFNAIMFSRQKLVRWEVALVVGPITAVAAFLSGRYAYSWPEKVLLALFAVILGFLAIRLQFSKPGTPSKQSVYSVKVVALSLLAGFMAGVAGIGSGALLSSALLLLGILKNQQLAPTANVIMVFTTASALSGYLTHYKSWPWANGQWGPIHFEVAGLILLAAFPVATFLRKRQAKLDERYRRLGLSLILSGLFLITLIRLF